MEHSQGITCPNGHVVTEGSVAPIVEYPNALRVRCLECRVIFSIPAKQEEKKK